MLLKGAFILLVIVAAVTADFECREEGIFADPDDCRSFYQCLSDPNAESGFDPIKDTCTIDLLFDDIVMVCNYPEFVDCGDRPIVDGSSSTTTSTVITTFTTTVTTTVATTVTSAQTTTTQGITAEFECPSEGMHADPDDCRSFYQCVYDQSSQLFAVKDTCDVTLLFDDFFLICNYPEAVDCGDRPIIDGPTSPTTSSVTTTVPTTVTMTVTTTATTTTVTSDQTTTSQVITTTR